MSPFFSFVSVVYNHAVSRPSRARGLKLQEYIFRSQQSVNENPCGSMGCRISLGLWP